MRPAAPVTQPLALEDRGRFELLLRAYAGGGRSLSAFSFIYHAIWQGLLTYEFVELEGHICLFARDHGGTFMALPPFGADPCGPAMARAFQFMAERNRASSVSRIENVPEEYVEPCKANGYRVVRKSADYLYRTVDLAGLKGDRYKAARVSYNHCV